MDISASTIPPVDSPSHSPASASTSTAHGNPLALPEAARCLGCGYLLRGLEEAKCPECGRGFNPGDPKTFDSDPSRSRRRRWIKRGAALVLIAALAYLLCPRGLIRSSIVFTQLDCDRQITVARTQLRPPKWIPFRYPGFSYDSVSPGKPNIECGPFTQVRVQFELSIGGNATGWTCVSPDQRVWVNEQLATPETAPQLLKSLLDPATTSLQVGPGGK